MPEKFIEIDRDTPVILPSNMEGCLSDNHLARFIVDVVEQLDLSRLEESYSGRGSKAYPPKVMLSLLFYCYAIGIFSSRKIETASYELIPVIFITGNIHPDHDTINTFRKRFLVDLNELFVEILLIAQGYGILKLGDISLDGTKIHANASKHKAMSWEYANKLEEQFKAEVKQLLKMAEEANQEKKESLDIPGEIDYRETRIEKILQVKQEIQARSQARYEQEKAEYEKKMAEREEKEKARGKKLGGRKPKEPTSEPQATDQVNFTDSDSRIMPTSDGGFEQSYNAQACVDIDTLIIVENHITQQPNDKQEIEPALQKLKDLPEELGQVKNMGADTGYFSDSNVKACDADGITPYIASGRQSHNKSLDEILKDQDCLPEESENSKEKDPVAQMQIRMNTKEGKEFYAKRKSTIEPTFGIIKEVMGFRQFLLRGLEAIKGEWDLVCIAFNLKRMHALA